jgi:hypothetical protein
VLLLTTAPALADDRRVDWLVDVRFERQLRADVGVTWSSTPLRRALTNLSRNQRVAILLDRRADPDREIDLSAPKTPLIELVRHVAAEQGLGVSRVDSVLYVGPMDTTKKLATLVELRRQELRRLPAAAQQRLLRPRPMNWPLLASPREIIDQVAADSGIRFYRFEEQIPHDLWPAGDLPPLDFAERVSLLAAGFGLTFEFSPDASAVRFVPIPDSVELTRMHKLRGRDDGLIERLVERFPDSRLRAIGDEIELVGLWEDHDKLARLLRGETEPVRPPATGVGGSPYTEEVTRYTVNDTTAPAGAILKQLAPRFGLKLWVEPRAAPKVQQRVRVDVKQVSRDELLRAVVEPAGLTFSIRGDTLEIRLPP